MMLNHMDLVLGRRYMKSFWESYKKAFKQSWEVLIQIIIVMAGMLSVVFIFFLPSLIITRFLLIFNISIDDFGNIGKIILFLIGGLLAVPFSAVMVPYVEKVWNKIG